jgi:amino acid adenylation domain-containing protein
VSDLSGRLARLSPRKQELLLRHLAARRSSPAGPGGIPGRQDGRTVFPLSLAQQRLWLLDRLRPGSAAAYNVCDGLRLAGPLSAAALGAAVGEVLRRHEVLRTTFALEGDDPVQIVGPLPAAPLPLVDLTGLAAAVRERELLRLAAAEVACPVDLARGPVSRFRLLLLAPHDHALLVTLHHVVSDAASMAILFGELRTLYAALAAGRPSPLPELALQYTDFAVWQRGQVAGEGLARQLAWWRERLAGAPTSLPLPTDRPRPPVPSGRGARLPLRLAPAGGTALAALAQRAGATPYMLFLAAFAVLLARSAGVDDLLLGMPVGNRSRPELEGLIGFFVDTAVLRVELRGAPPFAALLARVREACLETVANADLPFERIVEEVQPERDQRRTPLFQALLSLLTGVRPAASGLAPGVAVSRLPVATRSAKFDLELALVDEDGRFFGALEYDTDIFDPSTVARLAGHLANLLAAVARDPQTPVSALPLAGAAERHQVLVEWNDTVAAVAAGTTVAAGATVATLFAAQVARRPEAVALIAGGREVRYGELGRLAGSLASLLRARGVGAETRVAICLERSTAMVAAVLAVWQAGGAYVALDPDLPPERAAALLADSGAVALLTREDLLARLGPPPRTVICLDGERLPEGAAPAAGGEAPAAGTLATLAYVVYTSGSTGRPKGVLTPHGGVAGYLSALIGQYGIGPGDRVLQLPSLVFDASVRDLCGPLAAGATVVLAGQPQARDASALLSLIVRWQVTRLLSVVPTLLRALLAAAPPDGAPLCRLETLLLSGEPLLAADCREIRRVFGAGVGIVNQYGATECTMTSCRHPVAAEDAAPRPEVPVGRPIAGCRVYLLDPELRPVPLGAPGEIHLGGPGMARGYLDRPDLTAAAFLPDPFGPPGERLYATGDRARHLADGSLEFLGRLDQQLKIRGLRIEPGEVEAALAAQPGVRQAVVVMSGGGAAGRLMAYLLVDAHLSPRPAELRRALLARLPEPMVPSSFVVLDAMPLTATGKVDRRALAERAPDAAPAAVPPRDRVELELLHLWEELLPERIFGVRDDFFALGGHSLLAMRLLARIERQLGRALPLSVLLEAPTIESLAAALRQGRAAASSPRVVLQRGADGQRPLFLVHPAGGTALCYLPLARHLGRAQRVVGLEDPNFARPGEPRFVVPEMVALYAEAVREAQPHGPYRLGGWSLGGVLAQELARQLEAAGEEVEHLLLLDSRSPSLRVAAAADSETDLLLWFARNLGLPLDREDVDSLPAADRFPRIFARAQEAGRLPADLPPEQARRVFAVFLGELAAGRDFAPRPCRCRITLFRASAGVEEEQIRGDDLAVGWRGLSAAGLEIEIVPGAHQTLMDEPSVTALAQRIRARLAVPGGADAAPAAAGAAPAPAAAGAPAPAAAGGLTHSAVAGHGEGGA